MADKNVKAELNAEDLEEVAGGALREAGGEYFVMNDRNKTSEKRPPEDEGKKSGNKTSTEYVPGRMTGNDVVRQGNRPPKEPSIDF